MSCELSSANCQAALRLHKLCFHKLRLDKLCFHTKGQLATRDP